MPSSPSPVIRNDTIVDCAGGAPYETDLAVVDGRASAIGCVHAGREAPMRAAR